MEQEKKEIRQKIFIDSRTFQVVPGIRYNIDLQTNREFKKVIGIFFNTNAELSTTRINLRIDSEDIFKGTLIEAHTIHIQDEARTYKGVLFETNVRAEGSNINGEILFSNDVYPASGGILDMCLICEKH